MIKPSKFYWELEFSICNICRCERDIFDIRDRYDPIAAIREKKDVKIKMCNECYEKRLDELLK